MVDRQEFANLRRDDFVVIAGTIYLLISKGGLPGYRTVPCDVTADGSLRARRVDLGPSQADVDSEALRAALRPS